MEKQSQLRVSEASMSVRISSEHVQDQFMEMCVELGLTPRKAVLLAHTWHARTEPGMNSVDDSFLSFISEMEE